MINFVESFFSNKQFLKKKNEYNDYFGKKYLFNI